ncbi:hypothetical protein HUU05_27620 [candidate division KSB1 bacterium]|nr:hypothetical protein [candidate division KSB1 bacterium]
MLDQFIRAVLWLHIVAGFTGFFVAPVALVTRKGGNTHRKWGKVYFWAMTISVLSSLIVAAYRPNIFLFLIGIFSFYLAFSGYRVLRRKSPEVGQSATALDWTVASLTLATSLFMLIYGSMSFTTFAVRLNPILLLFGVLGLLAAGSDMYRFVWPSADKNAWYFDHMSGMVASYIAAVSAFSVVNFAFLPLLARWLWPTVVGAPLLVLWITRYKIKLHRAKKSVAVPAYELTGEPV